MTHPYLPSTLGHDTPPLTLPKQPPLILPFLAVSSTIWFDTARLAQAQLTTHVDKIPLSQNNHQALTEISYRHLDLCPTLIVPSL